VQEGGEKKNDADFPMEGHFYLDPAKAGTELNQEQEEINDSQNHNDRNPADFHKSSNKKRLKVQGSRRKVKDEESGVRGQKSGLNFSTYRHPAPPTLSF
jgi:hypothetical protein